MRTQRGAGCWPGRAEGRVVWLEPAGRRWGTEPVADRAAEVLRFRAEAGRAVSDLEQWSERQNTVSARVALQTYRDALLAPAWSQRVCSLIDREARPAAIACLEAAEAVGPLLARSPELHAVAETLNDAARWLAGRLEPISHLSDAVLAAAELLPVELLDLGGRPALIADPAEPPVVGTGPLVWGVPGLGPDWAGRRVAVDGARVLLDQPEPVWLTWDGERIGGTPVCALNGDMDALERMARKLGRRPLALVRRLDDLAAIPAYLAHTAGVALDLDKLGPGPRLKHPGTQLLLRAAADACKEAGLPVVAGGEPAEKQPDHWLAFGCTALFGRTIPRGGTRTHAIRRGKESSL